MLDAGSEKYKMSVTSGKNNGECKIEMTKKLNEDNPIVASLHKKSKDNKDKCMAGNKSSEMSKLYDELARLASSNHCNIRNISVKKNSTPSGDEAASNSGEDSKECLVKMSSDVTNKTQLTIKLDFLKGDPYEYGFNQGLEASELEGLFKSLKICYDTVEKRLDTTNFKKRAPQKQGMSTGAR